MSRRAQISVILSLAAASLATSGCCTRGRGAAPAPIGTAPVPMRPPEPEPEPAPAEDTALAARVAYADPGGMWMPQQLADQGELLRKLGLAIDPAALSEPGGPVLGAIVFLGNCTGSFVSKDGLIATNHHCTRSALQALSSPEADLVSNGYTAPSRAEEKYIGPAGKVYITLSSRRVTEEILGGLDGIADDLARHDEVERREKALVAACEKDRPGIKCQVSDYFRGAERYLIDSTELRDVRLVHVPHDMVGAFGGDTDNWMWPRHSGDYAFYRAYVDKDGKPADYAPDNVPYQPAHFLKLAPAGVAEHDLVMVAGYPAATSRLRTAAEIQESIDFESPLKIAAGEERIAILQALAAQSDALRIKASALIFRAQNQVKKLKGVLDGLTRGGVAADKVKLEEELRAWIAADASRAAYGEALDRLAAAVAARQETRVRDAAFGEATSGSYLLSAALTIVRYAEERPKPDADRQEGFQERDLPRSEATLRQLTRTFDRTVDRALLRLALVRGARDAKTNADWLKVVVGRKSDDKAIDKAIDKLYAKTTLEEEKVRLELLRGASLRDLKKSKDPFIQLALKLRPLQQAIEDRNDRLGGALLLVTPLYIEALRQFRGPMAPDANSTLRVTFGTVRGYKPRPDAPVYAPFTKLAEMIAKHTGQDPYVVPPQVLEAAKHASTSRWVDPKLGDVPVDFLSDLDITGGNSGSPTLNARGEFVGLAFDGNLEAVSSDVLFQPELTRTIHMDVRYMMWLLSEAYGAKALVDELNVD